jgi:hypothetical protein
MSTPTAGFQAKLVDELKLLGLIAGYLALLLGALTTYRRMLLAEYQIPYFRYGYVVVEALILAKVIVLGRYLGVGERFRDRPLIVPTLYKAVCFSGLELAFAVLEHLLEGWWHGEPVAAAWATLLGQGVGLIVARVVLLFVALLPLFAGWETNRVLGEGKLAALFFGRRAGGS